jgi:hypothetical protein
MIFKPSLIVLAEGKAKPRFARIVKPSPLRGIVKPNPFRGIVMMIIIKHFLKAQ